MLSLKNMTKIVVEHLITTRHANYSMMPSKGQTKNSQLKTYRPLSKLLIKMEMEISKKVSCISFTKELLVVVDDLFIYLKSKEKQIKFIRLVKIIYFILQFYNLFFALSLSYFESYLIGFYKLKIPIFQFQSNSLSVTLFRFIVSMSIINMIKSYKSSLQLNSYKIDTTSYEQKLHQLTRQNEELKTAIHQYKTKQNRMIDQLRNTKQQNNSLRIKIRTDTAQIEANCRNCSRLEHQLRELQGRANAEWQQQNEKAKQYKEMYENELQNKKAAVQYYQKKMHSLLRDKDVLIKKYEDKIRLIHTQYSQPNLKSQPHLDSTTSIERFFSPKKQAQVPEQSSQPVNIQKPVRKFPPSPQKVKQIKPVIQSQKVVAAKKKASEQQLDNLLIPFMQRLQKMNLTLKELRYIQQIDRFSSAGLVAKNRYIKLMREFPFECDDEQMIELSYEYIVTTLRNNRNEQTGANIIEFLMNRLTQLQQEEEE